MGGGGQRDPINGLAASANATSSLRVAILDPRQEFLHLRERWQRLASEVETATCFMHPAYFRAWFQCLSDEVDTVLLAAFANDELCGILPLARARVWRGPSCSPRIDYLPSDRRLVAKSKRPFPIDQLSPVISWAAVTLRPTLLCRPKDRQAVIAAMAAVIARRPSWDVIVIPVLEGEEEDMWHEGFRGVGLKPRTHRLHRNILTLTRVRNFAAMVAGENRNFRRNVRRAQAAADKLGIEFAVHEGRGAVLQRLDLLARVASASWKQDGRNGRQVTVPYEGQQQQFFETLLGDEDVGMLPVIAVAERRSEPIAVQLAFRHADTLTGVLTFMDKTCTDASPGLLLLGRLIDWAARNDVERIDLNATQEWLRHLADTRETLANVVVFAPSATGRVYALLSRLARLRHERKLTPPSPD